MMRSKKNGKDCKSVMKKQLSTPGPSLRIATESLENKICLFLKASKSRSMSQKNYKIWSCVSY